MNHLIDYRNIEQKQQNSLIAGLRATNEALLKQELDDEKKEGSIESEPDLKETDQQRVLKKSQNILNRSDSTGSTSGRKFLAPTLSDPQARNPKDTFTSNKKKPVRPTSTAKPSLTHFNEMAHHHNHHTGHAHGHEQAQATKMSAVANQVTMIYEVHDWWSEQVICTQSSDEEM